LSSVWELNDVTLQDELHLLDLVIALLNFLNFEKVLLRAHHIDSPLVQTGVLPELRLRICSPGVFSGASFFGDRMLEIRHNWGVTFTASNISSHFVNQFAMFLLLDSWIENE
jgi:hypothetical protein